MRSLRLWSIILVGLMASGLLVSATAFAMAGQDEPLPNLIVSDPVVPKLSPVMRDVTYVPPVRVLDREEINPIKNPGLFLPDFGLSGTNTKAQDPLVAAGLSPMAAPNPDINFEGQGDFNMYAPPDTTGDVGPDHFVQMVNVETAVYDKSGNLIDHWANNQLWAGFGGPCESDNSGDPIVLYDDLNNRWLLSQFAVSSGQHMCIAISTTSDPTGSYNLYAFPTPDFPDYPKLGVWPDGYYMGTNSGYPNQYYAHVFEREAMLVGDPATMISVGGQANFLMPADVDGTLPPANDAPGTFYTFFDGGYPNHPEGVDRLALYEFDVDWETPTSSTFSLVQEIPISEFNYTTCGFFERNCLQQLDTTNRLDAVDPWPMVRLQYRNFGPYEGMVGNFTVDVDGSDHAGIRWFELRRQGASTWDLQQEGTYAPDEHNRFMGSIAMDGSGNIALGYSITSASMYPSIRYTVHAKGDAPGTMQAEAELMAGSGSQTSTQRWGDYSATIVDPNDNCTFWITNMYHDQMDTGFSWNTRIGTFRVPGCTGSLGYTGAMDGVVTDSGTSDPIVNANVEATLSVTQTFSSSTDETGSYIFNGLPLGIYTVTASAFGYLPATVDSVEIFSGTTTTVDMALEAAPSHLVSGIVMDANTGWPLYANIDIDGYPGDLIWTDPETGYYEISLPEGLAFTFNIEAWVPGYLPASVNVGPLTSDTTQDFALGVDVGTCIAPGYSPDYAYLETFEADDGGYTHSGTYDEWEWGTPGIWPNLCAEGDNCWGTDLDDTYENSASNQLLSPVIDLSSVSAPLFVQWQQAWHIESASYDHAYVEASLDGGDTWIEMWSHSGSTTQTDWTEMSYDISDAAGGEIQFRWRFTSDSSVTYPGYYLDEVYIASGCMPQAGGLVVGNVYDANTLDALSGATVENEGGYVAETKETPFDDNVDDGFYTIFSPAGDQTFTAAIDGYQPDIETVSVVVNDTVTQDFSLGAGILNTIPTSLSVSLEMGNSLSTTLDLSNAGTADAYFEIAEKSGDFVPFSLFSSDIPAPQVVKRERLAGYHTDATSTEGIMAPGGTPVMGVLAAGDILAQWPSGDTMAWGDGFDLNNGTVWVNDNSAGGGSGLNEEFTTSGDRTGVNFTADFGGSWPGDMAYNVNTGMFWQINIGGDNCLHEWDPSIPAATGNVLCSSAWSTSERGLAYDSVEDTFFVGGWNDDTIWHIDNEGTLIDSWAFSGGISGLAYNSESSLLFIQENSNTDTITVVDVTTWTIVDSFAVPGFGGYSGAGLAIDCDGNLWATNQSDNNVYLIDSGVPASLCNVDVPWISEEPVTGTVATLSNQIIDVTFDASVPEIAQPGDYLATLRISHNTPYDKLMVPVTMTVLAPPTYGRVEGTVTGLGYCDNDPAPLADAEVVIVGTTRTITLTSDTDGTYQYWLDESEAPLTIYVTAAGHTDGIASDVLLTAGETTTQDFDLRLLESCVSTDPVSLEIGVELDTSVVVPLELRNTGALPTTFELQERDGGAVAAINLDQVGGSGYVDPNASAGPAPISPVEDGVPISALLPNGTIAYSTEASNSYHTGFDLDVPEVLPNLGNFSTSDFPGAGEYIDGYVYVADGGNTLYQLDAATGEVLSTLTTTVPPYDETWAGMAIDPTTGVVYASSTSIDSSSLFTLDVSTGEALRIGAITDSACNIGIVIDGSGQLYGYDICTNEFMAIDKDSGVTTVIGSIGFDANFGQGIGWDQATDTIYMAAFNYDTFQAELRTVDRETGNTTLIGALGSTTPGGTTQLPWLGIPVDTTKPDVPWLSEDPITGTLDADSSITVDVTFDASVPEIAQPGEYSAMLRIKNESSHSPLSVPVTMTVLVPPTYGTIEGTITGLGYCDNDPALLAGAQVVIVGATQRITLTTDTNGFYRYWLHEDEGPLTIYVAADRYEGMASDVPLTGGEITTQNFDLRLLEPCVSVDPASLNVTVRSGRIRTVFLKLVNDGALQTDFRVKEKFVPSATPPTPTSPTPTPMTPRTNPAHVVEEPESGEHGNGGISAGPDASGGPDAFGYVFRDSNNLDGPAFDWIEIAPEEGGLGEAVAFPISNDDDYYYPVELSFPFNFYGTEYTQLAVGTNGTLYFEDAYLGYNNIFIPSNNSYEIEPLIAHMWNDLVIEGNVYYQDFGDMIIFEYYDVRLLRDETTTWTWEVILFDNGNILMQYFTGPNSSYATVGIQQNVDVGLQYSYFTDVLSDELAICFAYPGNNVNCEENVPWLSEWPITGVVGADDDFNVMVTFNAWFQMPGTYSAMLKVQTDDPLNPIINVPVTMTVRRFGWGIEIAPATDTVVSKGIPGETITYELRITNTGDDPDTFALSSSGGNWKADISEDSVTLDPDESANFTVTVTIPNDLTDTDTETDTVTIVATGSGEATASYELTTEAILSPTAGVVITPITNTLTGMPGEIVTYTLAIANTGDMTNTFDITDSGATWDVSLSITSTTLGMGEETNLIVAVTIPDDAVEGDTDTTIITVSDNDDAMATAMLTTEVVLANYKILLPIIMVAP